LIFLVANKLPIIVLKLVLAEGRIIETSKSIEHWGKITVREREEGDTD
jgi:hypothetical protein